MLILCINNNIDKKLLQTVANHPVHILNKNEELSSSSFIPFCSFGEDLIGAKINGFEIAACNMFKPKIHNDQLCYETDLQELKDNNNKNLMKQLEIGLTLILDYNEERQIGVQQSSVKKSRVAAVNGKRKKSGSDIHILSFSFTYCEHLEVFPVLY